MEIDMEKFADDEHGNPSLKLSTWGTSLLYAPTIESMERQQGDIYEEIIKRRKRWLERTKLKYLMPKIDGFVADAYPVKLIADLPHVFHSPERDDPEVHDAITLFDANENFDVKLLNGAETAFRNGIGLTLPNRRLLRENTWHSPIMVVTDLRYYQVPQLIHVENPPRGDEMTPMRAKVAYQMPHAL